MKKVLARFKRMTDHIQRAMADFAKDGGKEVSKNG